MKTVTRKIVIGSRRSKLAIRQTEWVIEQLEKLNLPYTYEIKEISTKGDQILDVMLSKVGGKGLFVKEIEKAMMDHEIDFAVHSIKDMPAELPPGLMIACITEREDPRDCLISKNHIPLEELPEGAIVGTSSLRRSAQILHMRPDVNIKWIRGNIHTRMKKLQEEDYDAIVLAAAGLKRMNLDEKMVTQYLPADECIPAVGQGALGIECRQDDDEIIQLLQRIHDTETGITVGAERSFLARIEGGCQVPVACYAELNHGDIRLTGLVGTPDGKTLIKETMTGAEPIELGIHLADKLMEQGAKQILDEVRKQLNQ